MTSELTCVVTAQDAAGEGGTAADSWLCVDCGVNTAPGFSTKAELNTAFARGIKEIPQTITAMSEVYCVRDRVWSAAGIGSGCLCIGCLEKRLGRRLRPKDFQRGDAFNHPAVPGTPRLLDRRGRQG
jgi:hypothetical protein